MIKTLMRFITTAIATFCFAACLTEAKIGPVYLSSYYDRADLVSEAVVLAADNSEHKKTVYKVFLTRILKGKEKVREIRVVGEDVGVADSPRASVASFGLVFLQKSKKDRYFLKFYIPSKDHVIDQTNVPTMLCSKGNYCSFKTFSEVETYFKK